MTDEPRTAELAQLAAAATPGEWAVTPSSRGPHVALRETWETLAVVKAPRYRANADAAFIVAMRNATPALLARLALLEQALREIGGLQPKWPFAYPSDELAEAQTIALDALDAGETT